MIKGIKKTGNTWSEMTHGQKIYISKGKRVVVTCLPVMAQTLTLSLKLSPFPFAALAIAAYTQKADIVFDDAAKEAILQLNGSKISSQEDIIQALASDCASAEETPAVRGFARSATRKILNR